MVTQLEPAVSSDRQLWSVAGNLAMTYRVLFGLRYEADGLHLHPVIPQALGGQAAAYRVALSRRRGRCDR